MTLHLTVNHYVYNVYPRELEEVLYRHPAVEQCSVVGQSDLDVGELPVAFVQLQQGSEVTAEELMEHANSQIAAYKKVRKIKFLDSLPISPAGRY